MSLTATVLRAAGRGCARSSAPPTRVKSVIIRSIAALDINDAYLWYERQPTGLGHEFRDALRATLTGISEHLGLYQVVHRNTRRAFMRRFPYGIYYREYVKAIVVVACMHGSRDPRHWQTRG